MKGKDWYVILAPSMFSQSQLAETPAMDPRMLVGRTIESNLAELMGQPDKYYMNVKFRIEKVEGNKAYTRFDGYSCAREHLFRIVRRGSQKVRAVADVETTDGWKLQVISLFILNRNTDTEVKRKVRKLLFNEMVERAKQSSIDDFVLSVAGGILQREARKLGNKIYPIRFSEIESIEVKKAGQPDLSGPGGVAKE